MLSSCLHKVSLIRPHSVQGNFHLIVTARYFLVTRLVTFSLLLRYSARYFSFVTRYFLRSCDQRDEIVDLLHVN